MKVTGISLRIGALVGVAGVLVSCPSLARAADVLNAGDTAWLMTSSALVLMMTIPGLAPFYAGLVRSKNVLSILMQCFVAAGLVSVLWILVGYSIAFADGNAFFGGLSKFALS